MTREEAIKTLHELWRETNDSWYEEAYDMAIEALEALGNAQDTAQHVGSVERLKGNWIKISPANIYECSVCHQNVMTHDIDAYQFCHHCGADMRGEDND